MEVSTTTGLPKATIGRIVHFTFPRQTARRSWTSPEGQSEKVPAIITQVWSNELVNLTVFVDGQAGVLAETSVPLKDETNEKSGFYFEWPSRG